MATPAKVETIDRSAASLLAVEEVAEFLKMPNTFGLPRTSVAMIKEEQI
jgi:hypothetical protein